MSALHHIVLKAVSGRSGVFRLPGQLFLASLEEPMKKTAMEVPLEKNRVDNRWKEKENRKERILVVHYSKEGNC